MQVSIELNGQQTDVTGWVEENRLRTTSALASRLALCEGVNRHPTLLDQRTAELRDLIAAYKRQRFDDGEDEE